MRFVAFIAVLAVAGCLDSDSGHHASESCPAPPVGFVATANTPRVDSSSPYQALAFWSNMPPGAEIQVNSTTDVGHLGVDVHVLNHSAHHVLAALDVDGWPAEFQSADLLSYITNPHPMDGCWTMVTAFSSFAAEGGPIVSEAGREVVAGVGVHVEYAGFWTNGTLFGTNIASVHNSDWPRAGWYGYSDDAALPVYVFDQDRAERPPYWAPAHQMAPVTGTPVDGITRDPNGQVAASGATAGLGYYTTIKGFNEALKTMTDRTSRVVVLAPEDAYTVEGNEEHPLYGDALVFLIGVTDIVDLPCPAGVVEQGLCGAPGP